MRYGSTKLVGGPLVAGGRLRALWALSAAQLVESPLCMAQAVGGARGHRRLRLCLKFVSPDHELKPHGEFRRSHN